MGIGNRDYMKRRPDDDRDGSSTDSRLEAMLSHFLHRHPRFFIYVGVGLVALIVLAFLAARFS